MSIKKFLRSLFSANAAAFTAQSYAEPMTAKEYPEQSARQQRPKYYTAKEYPEQSARQQRPKYYTAKVNGFTIMQRRKQIAV